MSSRWEFDDDGNHFSGGEDDELSFLTGDWGACVEDRDNGQIAENAKAILAQSARVPPEQTTSTLRKGVRALVAAIVLSQALCVSPPAHSRRNAPEPSHDTRATEPLHPALSGHYEDSDAMTRDFLAELHEEAERCASHCTMSTFMRFLSLAQRGECDENSFRMFREEFPEFHDSLRRIADILEEAERENGRSSEELLSSTLRHLHAQLSFVYRIFLRIDDVVEKQGDIAVSLHRLKDIDEQDRAGQLASAQQGLAGAE